MDKKDKENQERTNKRRKVKKLNLLNKLQLLSKLKNKKLNLQKEKAEEEGEEKVNNDLFKLNHFKNLVISLAFTK
jgi:hypothetical protein